MDLISNSDIYNLQKIVANIHMMIYIADKGKREDLDPSEKNQIFNCLENTTILFYTINENIHVRSNENA